MSNTNQMKVYTYRMDETEHEKANKECERIYKVPLSTLLRTIVVNHFPAAKISTTHPDISKKKK